MKDAICIYHGPDCLDGWAAAWVVKRQLGEHVALYPCDYGQPPPVGLARYRQVLIVDFSFPEPEMRRILQQCQRVIVLDHHKTARDALSHLSKEPAFRKHHIEFDMERSGCVMAHDFLVTGERPRLLLHVQDWDLHGPRCELPGTTAIKDAADAYPRTIPAWEQLVERCEFERAQLIAEGVAISAYLERMAERLCEAAVLEELEEGILVPFVNCPQFLQSKVGHMLAQGMPYSVVYYDEGGVRHFGLRSAEEGSDVSDVAKEFGGGGHKHAAGFKVTLPSSTDFVGQ